MSAPALIGYSLLGLLVAGVLIGWSFDLRRWLHYRGKPAGLREREAADQLDYLRRRLIHAAPQHPPLNRSRPLVSEPSGSRGEQEFEGGTRDSTA